MKSLVRISIFLGAAVVLSGCSLTKQPVDNSIQEFYLNQMSRSTDSGESWLFDSNTSLKSANIGADIMIFGISPWNSDLLYATNERGLFASENGGSTWKEKKFPTGSAYAFDFGGSENTLFASGMSGNRGVIFKSIDNGESWKEVYNEPSVGTSITAIHVNRADPRLVYVGTSTGMFIKSSDEGKTWENIYQADGLVEEIMMLPNNASLVYLLTRDRSFFRSRDGGASFQNLAGNLGKSKVPGRLLSVALDLSNPSVFYAGTDKGIAKTSDQGDTFVALNLIEISKRFPIRAIAVNPGDSKEIMYNAGQAVYKSTNGGEEWFVNRFDTSKGGYRMKYNPRNTKQIFISTRTVKK